MSKNCLNELFLKLSCYGNATNNLNTVSKHLYRVVMIYDTSCHADLYVDEIIYCPESFSDVEHIEFKYHHQPILYIGTIEGFAIEEKKIIITISENMKIIIL